MDVRTESYSAAVLMAVTTRLAESRNLEHGPFPHRGPDEGYLIGARNVDPVNGGETGFVPHPIIGSMRGPV